MAVLGRARGAALRGLPAAYRRVLVQARSELRVRRRHRAAVKAASRYGAGIRLHLACGPNTKPGWVNVDLFHPAADLALDLREPLPFRAGQVAEIYGEHFFEHLDWPGDADAFLAECLRVLVPGGRLSLVVPDAGSALDRYAARDEAYFARVREQWGPPYAVTAMDSVNYTFRQDGEHRYAYDEETLVLRLTTAGFTGATRREYDPAIDSERRSRGDLRVDAVKPDDR
jgi:predicted SAM-dependent methyltransferase